MDVYYSLRIIHISCAILSISGFILRGIWLIQDSSWLQNKATKRLPHIVDTLLLLSALLMVYLSQQYPFVLDWLTVKVICLLIYILLGMVALRWGTKRHIRIMAWLLAVSVFFFIISVALTRSPFGFIALF